VAGVCKARAIQTVGSGVGGRYPCGAELLGAAN
jgi:hypothetical protein